MQLTVDEERRRRERPVGLQHLAHLNNVEKDSIVLRLFRIWSDAEGYMREELHTVMAGNVLVTLPAFIIFFIAQKRFIQGIVTTGIKG